MNKLKKRTITALITQIILLAYIVNAQTNETEQLNNKNLNGNEAEISNEIEINSPIKKFKQKIYQQIFHLKSQDQEEYFFLKFEINNLKLKEKRDIDVSVQEIDSNNTIYRDFEGQYLKSNQLQIIGNLKPNRDYLVVVLIKDEQPLEYDLIITTSNYFHCPSNCSLNGVCNKQKQVCECNTLFIGNTCSFQATELKESQQKVLQILNPKSQLFYQYFDHFSQENIDQIEINILLPEKIQQQVTVDLYMSTGSLLPIPTQSFSNYINPIQDETKGIFKIIVDKEHFYDEKGEPIPLNLSIYSSSEKQTIFYIQVENIESGYVQQMMEVIIKEYIFVILAIVILLFVISFLKYRSNKKKQEPTLLINKVKTNQDDSLPITNELEQKPLELVTPQFDSNNKYIFPTSPSNQIKSNPLSPRRKLQLGLIKTLSLEIVDIYMPVQKYYGYIYQKFKNVKTLEHQESVDQNQIKTDTSPHDKDDKELQKMYKKHIKCQVCEYDFKQQDNVRQSICSHVFHDQCLVFWLSNHEECPKCKQSLSKISLYQHEIDTKQHYKRQQSD